MEGRMGAEAVQDLDCGVLRTAEGDQDSLVRFVVGSGEPPKVVSAEEIGHLGDPLAKGPFASGLFPRTAQGVLDMLDQTVPNAAPADSQTSFIVGEGSQLPADNPRASVRTFLVTRTRVPNAGPEIVVAAQTPEAEGLVEVMAWDDSAGGFNYYQTTPGQPWILAGNSADALRSGSAGAGPFESHPSGNAIMKELRLPWVHWKSFRAPVPPAVAPQIAAHPWFMDAIGAETFEAQIQDSVRRWNRIRLDRAVTDDLVGDALRLLQPLFATPTVNLISADIEWSKVMRGEVDSFAAPIAFFLNAHALRDICGLELPEPDKLQVQSLAYREALTEHGITLRENGEPLVPVPSDTHFAFLVPEPAFEDTELLALAAPKKDDPDEGTLLSRRLIGCALMVDFANPVLSERRAALARHVTGDIPADGFSQRLGDAIAGSSEAGEEGAPEAEFAELWNAGEEGWKDLAQEGIAAYAEAIKNLLAGPEGAKEVFRLAQSRREQVSDMPIHSEVDFLFATPPAKLGERLRMSPGAQVLPVG
ncbi:MAG: hypothetical protein KY395_04725 [Actinobacteria bacterium]|nr:hypothetical protein [Actinomycetota bacterium]